MEVDSGGVGDGVNGSVPILDSFNKSAKSTLGRKNISVTPYSLS